MGTHDDSLEPSPAQLGDTMTIAPGEWTPLDDHGTEIYVYGDQPVDVAVQIADVDDDDRQLRAEVDRLRARRGYASQRLDKARAAAEELLRKEQQHNGSGRAGHLAEADLVPLFEALGVVYLDRPDSQVFVSSDGDPE